ncbi:MAG: hypothetical protein WEA58_08610 [Balneolaceae bacterium]
MKTQNIANELVNKIKEKCKATTNEIPEVSIKTRPFKDLSIFDSLLISEVGIELEDEIGFDFKEIKKVFEQADIEGLTIYEMAGLIANPNKN